MFLSKGWKLIEVSLLVPVLMISIPQVIFYFFRLLQFSQSNFPLVGAYYLSRSGDVKCFINHFAPATCRTASVSSQKRFIDSQQIGMALSRVA